MTDKQLERTFYNIVAIAHDATGRNAAFEPEYGMHVLNDIRRELGLKIIDTGNRAEDIKTMKRLLW